MEQKLTVIRTSEEVLTLLEYLKDKEYVSFDTETTGVTEDAEIIGYSICAEENVGYYVIAAEWDVATSGLKYLPTVHYSTSLFIELAKHKLIMHNGAFDCATVARNYEVQLIDSLFCDTMILAHLIDENRPVGLKELGVNLYGNDAKKEQDEMKASVVKNGGQLSKKNYELYKGDANLIAKYGAKDAILTYNLFYEMLPQLYEEGLDKFFFDDESMPLLRGVTYQLNTTGLKVDKNRLDRLKIELEADILKLKGFIDKEVHPLVKDAYPGTSKAKTFNLNSGQQMAWLLFDKLKNTFPKLSKTGRELAAALGLKNPYLKADKETFIEIVKESLDSVWREPGKVWDKKLRKFKGKAKVKAYWNYLAVDRSVLAQFSQKYKWVAAILEHRKLEKLLSTYVKGIEAQLRYGIIHPSFLQHGTTSGRYSSRNPNFQNLPRDDKRVKDCIVSRPGKVFVGADYAQLEPRTFASISGDKTLLECFRKGEDFYSVVGAPIFNKRDCSLFKSDSDSFAKLYPKLRDGAKIIALATPYGRTASQQASAMGISKEEAQTLINTYFEAYPSVELMMLESHEIAKTKGYVENIFGRRRRIPDAKKIVPMYGNVSHNELPYDARNLLNLAMNHRVQSTAASIMNRAAIRFLHLCKQAEIDAKLVLQIHDEIVAECNEADADDVVLLMKEAMENTVTLPGVALVAEPKIGKSLAELK